ncbi:hypothetical protein COO60DRAFT_1490324 [Scenedesmus sp. NREL 46B-D3]|nr:hypothetical protein COO60DRAFT_1490324 [Scenedesmus sp. NREL 46B-D3]
MPAALTLPAAPCGCLSLPISAFLLASPTHQATACCHAPSLVAQQLHRSRKCQALQRRAAISRNSAAAACRISCCSKGVRGLRAEAGTLSWKLTGSSVIASRL